MVGDEQKRTREYHMQRAEAVTSFIEWAKKRELGPGMNDRGGTFMLDDENDVIGFDVQWSPYYSGYDGTVGRGWLPLLDKLVDDLIALGWDRSISQIKEKFGTLRFYADNVNDKMLEVIAAAEDASSKICEYCGQPGEIRTTGWHKTLCDSCHASRR